MLRAKIGVILIGMSMMVPAADYDVVIANGRVIDPETHLDAIKH